MKEDEALGHALNILEGAIREAGPMRAHNYYRFRGFSEDDKEAIMSNLDELVEECLQDIAELKKEIQ